MNWWSSIIRSALNYGAAERCARFFTLRVKCKAAKKCMEDSGFLLTSNALDQVLDSRQSYSVCVLHSPFWTIIIMSNFLIFNYLVHSFFSLFLISSLLSVFKKLMLIHFHTDTHTSIIVTWQFCILFSYLFLGILLAYFLHSQLYPTAQGRTVFLR